jgi:predicted lactoylglutathione lyase
MKLPGGHAKRLFIGFICSIGFLSLFAVLVAHNTEADSRNNITASVFEYPLTIRIPTPYPQDTIEFYKKLGFNVNTSLSGDLDTVCMEKGDTPYKIKIFHRKRSEKTRNGEMSPGFSFPVQSLNQALQNLQAKGACPIKPLMKRDEYGSVSASLKDPNGVKITLYEQ